MQNGEVVERRLRILDRVDVDLRRDIRLTRPRRLRRLSGKPRPSRAEHNNHQQHLLHFSLLVKSTSIAGNE